MLVVITLAVILGGSFIILTTRWIPVVKAYQHLEEFPYSYSYTVTENREIPHEEAVLTTGSITLMAFAGFTYPSSSYWVSKDFHLGEGWKVMVTFQADSDVPLSVALYVMDGFGWGGTCYYYNSISNGKGSFIAPRAGQFHVIISNLDSQKHVASAELTAEWIEVQSEQRVENVTKTTTFDVTMYNVTYVRPIDLILRRT